jgi:bacteriorhodopsin
MLFMLVESRDPFDDGERSSREPWLVGLVGWLLPWPALIVWLCAASRVLDGWIAVACIYSAIVLCIWRGLRALPADGLNQQRQ